MGKIKKINIAKAKVKITKAKVKQTAIDFAILFAACCIGSFSTVGILIPNGLTSGGVTGIVRILQKYVDVNFSIMYYIGTLIILILCIFVLGKKEAKRILVMSFLYPAALFIMEQLNVELLEEKDIILAVIYCGIFSGICSGIVLSRGYSFGGSDTVAKMIQKKLLPHMQLSKVLLAVDAIVIISSALVFSRNIALYALVTTIIASKTIDIYMYGMQVKIVEVGIITEKCDEMTEFILNEINRGVTLETVTGAYTNERKKKLITLCSPRESVLIMKELSHTDEHALVTVMAVDTVWGHGPGFKTFKDE